MTYLACTWKWWNVGRAGRRRCSWRWQGWRGAWQGGCRGGGGMRRRGSHFRQSNSKVDASVVATAVHAVLTGNAVWLTALLLHNTHRIPFAYRFENIWMDKERILRPTLGDKAFTQQSYSPQSRHQPCDCCYYQQQVRLVTGCPHCFHPP